jgi:putative redox protein
MTLLGYAKHKGIPLEGVDLDLSREKPAVGAGDAPNVLRVSITLHGNLDAAQRAKLLEVAGKCPVNRTLSGRIEIRETLS